MATNTKTDKFANQAYGTVTETGANTLTFSEIQTHVDVFSKQAWIIQRIQWYLTQTQTNKILDTADSIALALTCSNKASSLSLQDPALIDLLEFQIIGVIAAGLNLVRMPLTRDFETLPGGGIIITPRPLYIAAQGTSLASAITASARIYFTQVTLPTEQYWELVEARRMVE